MFEKLRMRLWILAMTFKQNMENRRYENGMISVIANYDCNKIIVCKFGNKKTCFVTMRCADTIIFFAQLCLPEAKFTRDLKAIYFIKFRPYFIINQVSKHYIVCAKLISKI